jgi:hypothetical protein
MTVAPPANSSSTHYLRVVVLSNNDSNLTNCEILLTDYFHNYLAETQQC